MTDIYPLGQVNLVVSDLERSRKFFGRFGWKFEPIGDAALLAQMPGGALVSIHLPEFVRLWNAGYDGSTGGATVLDISLPDRESVDRLHAEFTSEDTDLVRSQWTPSGVPATRSWRIPTATSWA